MLVCFMTIFSSLLSPRLIRRFETKWIVIVSTAVTVAGLIGFSLSGAYWMLFIFAVPYGLGAGAVDAALNQYVANHYSSRVMNFLHCFYGLGAVISPNIMALALKYARWNEGYRWTAYLQLGILFICILSIPLWKVNSEKDEQLKAETATIKEALKVPGVVLTLIAFFSYCAGEATCFLWTSSYFAGTKTGMSEELIAAFGSLVFGGLMLGRLIAGFVSDAVGDRIMIRVGIAVEFAGILLVALPVKTYIVAAVGFLIVGIGMGPVYPAIQHMAPVNFGARYSAPVIGLQMASAYIGATLMPAVFGYIQQYAGIWIMPLYIALFAALNIALLEIAYKRLAIKKTPNRGLRKRMKKETGRDMVIGRKIIVLGSPGSGKSTFSRKLHAVTGLPLIHLDNVWWKPDRTHISREEFDAKLAEFLQGDEWIIDGDYSRTYEVRFRACDTVIFLDLCLDQCMEGIAERIGKDRPDIPWTEREADPELIRDVEEYREKKRPVVLSLMEQYPDKIQLRFTSRAEADGWLDGFCIKN